MSKYSCEFKKEIVMAYINDEGGYGYLVNKYGVKSSTNIVKWAKTYKEFGDDGLIRSRQNKKYTFEFKLSVVELYLTTEISYQELAILKIRVTSKIFTRKSRKYSSYKGTIGVVAKNRVNRRFNTSIVHQKITTDTTEFKYYEFDSKGKLMIKKLYLDPFMDMYNREIISYSISPRPSAENIMNALNRTIEITSDCKYRRTFHSDQGWAYQMKSYSKTLKDNKIFQSMSRKGNCLDNTVMENFFGAMKQEMYYGNTFYSFDELKSAIEKYIEYYNTKRTKQVLDYFSPIEYRLKYQVP